MIGRRLAHYEIVEKLGEGGMGAVYKARDHHLDRFIAIKVLPPGKVSEPERKRRFVQEAKAASALNHPNIVTIHDIAADNGTDYIAMEYVKGQTLQSLAGRRGLPVADVLKYGIQIADAVAAAHAAGIVHRDLKPANVMVGDHGVVKVLDFGLAKLAEPEPLAESDATRTLHQAAPATEEGQILGTLAYMAPEQVEGRKIDARTDVFAFGSVLYELITGRRAFERNSRIATLSAILKDSTPPLSELAKDVPPELDRIVARCLRKDPDRRYQSMRDVKNALEELKEDSESGRLTSSPIPKVDRGKITPAWWTWAAALLLAAAAGGAWLWKSRSSPPAELVIRALTADSGLTTTPAISADGKLVAYASDRATQKDLDIWVHPLTEGGQPIRVTKNESDDLEPSFSPDGGRIVFRSKRDGGGIYVVPALGGEEQLLVRGGSRPRFSPDGTWVAYSSGQTLGDSRILLVSVAGGPPKRLASDVRWAGNPVFSHDGRHLLFLGGPSGNATQDEYDWWVTPVEGGASVKTETLPLLFKKGLPRPNLIEDSIVGSDWLDGRILFSAAGHVWEVGISPRGWKGVGPARQVTSGASSESEPRAAIAGGKTRIVFGAGASSAHLWGLKLDPNKGRAIGVIEPLSHAGGRQVRPAGSADGRKLIYTQSQPGEDSLRIRDLAAGKDSTLVRALARGKLSPDGSQAAYATQNAALYLLSAVGGDPVKLVDFKGSGNIYGWSPDGKKILYWYGSPLRFSTVDVNTGQTAEFISHPQKDIHGAELSPDQRWASFHSPSGRFNPIYIAPVRDGHAAGESEWIKVIDRGVRSTRPWWSPDGNLLYFITQLDGYFCIYAQRLDAGKHPAGEPFPVYHFHHARLHIRSGTAAFGPAILPDRIIFSLDEESGNVWIGEQQK